MATLYFMLALLGGYAAWRAAAALFTPDDAPHGRLSERWLAQLRASSTK